MKDVLSYSLAIRINHWPRMGCLPNLSFIWLLSTRVDDTTLNISTYIYHKILVSTAKLGTIAINKTTGHSFM